MREEEEEEEEEEEGGTVAAFWVLGLGEEGGEGGREEDGEEVVWVCMPFIHFRRGPEVKILTNSISEWTSARNNCPW